MPTCRRCGLLQRQHNTARYPVCAYVNQSEFKAGGQSLITEAFKNKEAGPLAAAKDFVQNGLCELLKWQTQILIAHFSHTCYTLLNTLTLHYTLTHSYTFACTDDMRFFSDFASVACSCNSHRADHLKKEMSRPESTQGAPRHGTRCWRSSLPLLRR